MTGIEAACRSPGQRTSLYLPNAGNNQGVASAAHVPKTIVTLTFSIEKKIRLPFYQYVLTAGHARRSGTTGDEAERPPGGPSSGTGITRKLKDPPQLNGAASRAIGSRSG